MSLSYKDRQKWMDGFLELLNKAEVYREGHDIILDLGTDPDGSYVEVELSRYSIWPTDDGKVVYGKKAVIRERTEPPTQ